MATIYTYSLSTDFSGNLTLEQLKDEINAEVEITQTCTYVSNVADDVNIEFTGALITSEETKLGTVISNHVPATNTPGATFDAVCDPTGNADYLKPSDAFADGHKSVFMRNGVYFESTDINIPEYGSLVGESGPNTVIHFLGLPNSIKADGSGGVVLGDERPPHY